MAHALEEVFKKPIITEKSTMQASTDKKFTFEVPSWATKDQIKEAFKKCFPNLKLVKVNTGTKFGKTKRTPKGRKEPRDSKKAIITIAEGHIEYFPEV